jgi:hypothetical protein
MGIQINGQTDTVASTTSGGSVTLTSAVLPSVSNISATRVNVSGVSTFTSGPVLIGSGTSTGTASQPLQVTGGAYVSGSLGIGTASPSSLLHLFGNSTQLNVQAPSGESQIRLSSGTGNYRRILFVDSAATPTKNNFQIAQQEVDNSLHIGPSTAVGGFTFSGSTGLVIDSSGRIKTPNQPAFLAFFSSSSDTTTNSGAVFAFNRTDYNIGSHFDTSTNVGRFTAPVAGIYAFSWAMFFTNSGGNTQGMNVAFLKNGSQYNVSGGGSTSDAFQISNTPNSTGGTISNSATYYFNLSANDYIELYARGANVRLYQGHSHFCGYLVG